MTDVFISYKHRMMPRVAEIADELKKLGLDVWYDAGLVSGSDYADAISKQLRAAKCVLVCWSNDAFPHGGDKNGWVRGEAEKGRDRNALVAVMLEETDLDPPWNMVHYERLIEWTPESPDRAIWQRVLSAIGALVGRPGMGEYDRAVHAGTSTALSSWARQFVEDPLAASARARAKELYLAEAAAKFEAEEDDRTKDAERAEEAQREARAKVDVERIRKVQHEVKERAEREALARAEAEARDRAANASVPPSSQSSAPPAAVGRPQRDTTNTVAAAKLTPGDVLIYGGIGVAACFLPLLAMGNTDILDSMSVGVPLAVLCVSLYSLPLAFHLWRRGNVGLWRAAAMAVGIPAIGLATGFVPNQLYGTVPLVTFGLAGFLGAVLTVALLVVLRVLPFNGVTLARAAAAVVLTTVVTGAAAMSIGGMFGPASLAWLTLSWQVPFTLGLALTVWSQPGRSASSM